jgi:hypothetical protein
MCVTGFQSIIHKMQVHGSRFTEKYLSVRQHGRSSWSTYSGYSYAPSLPYRSPSPTASTTPSVPSVPSPSRKVLSDFAAFGAPTSSVFGTKVASTPFSLAGGKAAFGTIRNGSTKGVFGADEDEEEEQKILFKEGAITFDQVSNHVSPCDELSDVDPRQSGSRCNQHGEELGRKDVCYPRVFCYACIVPYRRILVLLSNCTSSVMRNTNSISSHSIPYYPHAPFPISLRITLVLPLNT